MGVASLQLQANQVAEESMGTPTPLQSFPLRHPWGQGAPRSAVSKHCPCKAPVCPVCSLSESTFPIRPLLMGHLTLESVINAGSRIVLQDAALPTFPGHALGANSPKGGAGGSDLTRVHHHAGDVREAGGSGVNQGTPPCRGRRKWFSPEQVTTPCRGL